MVSLQLVAVCLMGLTALQLSFAAPTISTTPTPRASNIGNSTSVPAANIATSPNREALAPVFGKRFRYDHCENLHNFIEQLEIEDDNLIRIFNESFTSGLMLNEDNGEYKMTFDVYWKINNVPVKLFSLTKPFPIGQEFMDVNFNGENGKVVFSQDNNTLIMAWGDQTPETIIWAWTFTPEELKINLKYKDPTIPTFNCSYKPE